MLGWMRKQTKSWFVYSAFGIIIIVFVFFYGYGGRGAREQEVAALVNDQEITRTQLERSHENLLMLSRNIYQRNLTAEETRQLKQRALDELIDRALVLQEAEARGLEVSLDETRRAIADTPAFQREGVFDKPRYLNQLAASRLGPSEFEKLMRAEMLVSKAMGVLQDPVKISDRELFGLYRLENEKVNLRFVKLNAIDFENEARLAPEEVRECFEKTKDSYRVPARVKVRYLLFDPELYREEAVVSPQETEEFYRVNTDRFTQRKKIKARHILIEIKEPGDNAAEEGARTKAEGIRKRIEEGEDFSQLAKMFSQDAATASKGGDLGYFEKGQMVPELEEIAFSLKTGEVGPVARTPRGFDIVKAEAVQEEELKPLEKVKDVIEKELKAEKAEEHAREEARSASSQIFRSGNLADYADKKGMKAYETDFFAEGEPIAGIGAHKDFSDAAFLLGKGEVSPVVGLGEKYCILQLMERKEAYLPDLEEVREKVVRLKKKEVAGARARDKAEKLLGELASGSSLDRLATREGMSIEETGFFTRREGPISKIGYSKALAKEAFLLTEKRPIPQKVYDVGNLYFIVELKEKEEASQEGYQKEKEKIRERLLAEKREEAAMRWRKELREKAKIKVLSAT